MADLGVMFDPNSVEPSGSMEPVPNGDYKLALTESDTQPTKNNDGKFLKCTFTVLEGEFKGRKIWTNFNFWNKNPQAVEIAWRQFGDLCRACGIYRAVKDSVELHDIPFMATVNTRTQEGYRPSNEIAVYIARAPEQGTPAKVTPPPAAQASGAPATAAPAAAGASTEAVPPWLAGAGG